MKPAALYEIRNVTIEGGCGIISLNGQTVLGIKIEPVYRRLRATLRGITSSGSRVVVLNGFVAEGVGVEARERVLGEQSLFVSGKCVLDARLVGEKVVVSALDMRLLDLNIYLAEKLIVRGEPTADRYVLQADEHAFQIWSGRS